MNPREWGPGEWTAALSVFVVVVGLIAHAIRPNEAPSPLVTPYKAPSSLSDALAGRGGTSGSGCDVMGCQEAPTKSRHGWSLCAGHYAEKVTR